MRIQTLEQVNGRTADGRVYAAGEGAVTDIDDADVGMVALMTQLAANRSVEILEVEPAEASDPDDPGPKPTVEEQAIADAALKEELAQLRTEAEALGVKVDGRWGADRLRQEIAAAGAE